ncbi:MAG TPA: outer membrane beta-barrel protein [Candidatus Solibacter sp.]|nr:outer membrane beta-barrel protein [Candidatus Solibacter sp.]
MKTGLLLIAAAGMVYAQNSDLGLLISITTPSSQRISAGRIEGTAGGGVQINYAAQLKENAAGRLYLELPVLIGARSSGTVSTVIRGSTVTGIYFTPGLRYNVTLHPRTSLYVAGGAGVGSFNYDVGIVAPGVISSTSTWTSSFAVAFGGGLDFRLTRLISLRAEVRDFVSRKGIGLTDGRNHPVFGFGMGFHW